MHRFLQEEDGDSNFMGGGCVPSLMYNYDWITGVDDVLGCQCAYCNLSNGMSNFLLLEYSLLFIFG